MLNPDPKDVEIRRIVYGLVESAPPAPDLSAILDSHNDAGRHPRPGDRVSWSKRSMYLPRRRIIGLALAVLAIATTVSLLLAVNGSTPSSAAVLRKLTAALAYTQPRGTVHIEETESSTDAPTEHFVADVSSGTGAFRITGQAYEEPNEFCTTIQLRSIGYVRCSDSRSTPVATPGWFSYAVPVGLVKDPVAAVQSGALGDLVGVEEPITTLGARMIGGVKTTGYRFTVNVELLIRQAKTTYEQDQARSLRNKGTRQFQEFLWIASNGSLRELEISTTTRLTASLTQTNLVTNTYSYSSQVLSLVAPPSADTTAVSNAIEPAGREEVAETLAQAHEYRG